MVGAGTALVTLLLVTAAGPVRVDASTAVVVRGAAVPQEVDAPATAADRGVAGPVRPLAVPYVAQTRALCGGAAVSMVLRYRGVRGIYPEDFAGLLDREAGGIPTDRLSAAVRGLGCGVVESSGDLNRLSDEIGRGEPPIVLIEVGPRRYHYVVVTDLGFLPDGTGQVTFHDPAVRPARTMSAPEFQRRWNGSGRWMLNITSPPLRAAASRSADAPAEDDLSRARRVENRPGAAPADSFSMAIDNAVDLARSGDLAGASALLVAARSAWPDSERVVRELAGLRYLEGQWRVAAHLAEMAARLAPGDTLAWLIAGSSRFNLGDTDGALEAWNEVSEPRLDWIDVEGLSRTRHPVLAGYLGLKPGRRLTPATVGRTRRRLEALPTLGRSRVDYRPVGGGRADLRMAVVERPLLWEGKAGAASFVLDGILNERLALRVAGPTGNGEVASLAWRWPYRRARLEAGLALPSPFPIPGVIQVRGFRERQTYSAELLEGESTAGKDRHRVEERRRVSLAVGDWASPLVHWTGGAAFDRFDPGGDRLALSGAVQLRGAGDAWRLSLAGERWVANGASPFSSGQVRLDGRSRAARGRIELLATARLDVASAGSPAATWPGAGTGRIRDGLLRAHPLAHSDVIDGVAFGRKLVNGTAEIVAWPGFLGPFRLGGAIFCDAARTTPGVGASQPSQYDVGLGLRLRLLPERVVRLDLAHGLEDGATALSLVLDERTF